MKLFRVHFYVHLHLHNVPQDDGSAFWVCDTVTSSVTRCHTMSLLPGIAHPQVSLVDLADNTLCHVSHGPLNSDGQSFFEASFPLHVWISKDTYRHHCLISYLILIRVILFLNSDHGLCLDYNVHILK